MKRKIVGIFVCMLVITTTGITVIGTVEKKNEFQRNEQNSDDLIEMWTQEPDEQGPEVNICCDQFGAEEDIIRVLANDFECTQTGWIVEIHLYGSWLDDASSNIDEFNLTIYSDIPASESPTGYSMPNMSDNLWNYVASSGFYDKPFHTYTDEEMWWDPYTGTHGEDKEILEYIITIPEDEAFLQQGTEENPIIYWLAVHAKVDSEGYRFGLTSSYPHLLDDSVMRDYENPYNWTELYYPAGHPHQFESIDFALTILLKVFNPNALVWDPPGPFDILLVDFDLINEGNDTIPHFPYEIIAVGTDGLIPTGNSSDEGTIENLKPGEAITLKTPRIIGIGPFDVTVKVMGYELGSFKSFVFLIFIFNNYG